MANNHPLWTDDYWPLLVQLYMRKPVGIKPMYSRAMIALSTELHIPPQVLYNLMFRLRRHDSPAIQRLWGKYGDNPKALTKAVRMVRRMAGFGSGGLFYEGVAVNETFEADFKPVAGCDGIMPVMLILVLDLYYRLTPATMVSETPEVRQTARTVKASCQQVVDILALYRQCDPYLNYRHSDAIGIGPYDANEEPVTPLLNACRGVWRRFEDSPEDLSALAAQMKEFFA